MSKHSQAGGIASAVTNIGAAVANPNANPLDTAKWVRHGNPWYTPWSPLSTYGSFPYSSRTNAAGGDNTSYTDYNTLAIVADSVYPTSNDACRVVSGYYYGATDTGIDCFTTYNTFAGYNQCKRIVTNAFDDLFIPLPYWIYSNGNGPTVVDSGNPFGALNYARSPVPNQTILSSGCKWKEGVPLDEVERLLNLW